ncbi:MAG: PaaI family thioesterase [Clostridiales bacterium]|nr:PaaI family thioesterase [Clostridiales bacterium]
MSRIKQIFEDENFEKGIKSVISNFKEASRVSKSMDPSFYSYSTENQTVTIEFPVLEYQLNEHDTMHAGFIATAFDEALGIFASYLCEGKPSVSINISLNYIKPIPKNDSILITAKVTSLGRRFITMSGE